MSEMRELPKDANVPPEWRRSIPVRPSWQDFKIDGNPLFEACGEYLKQVQVLTS
jgi:hypothetical protein